MNRIYLDYAATTPLDPEVLKTMAPYFSEKFGNPGSLHRFGQEASAAVFKSRKTIADAIGAGYREIIFTGSATEANNLALRGIFNMSLRGAERRGNLKRDYFAPPLRRGGARNDERPRIITTAIEHDSIYETCRDLEKQGVEVVFLPVNKEGFVDLKALKAALDERTVLVSIGYANGEIGTIQNLPEISDIIRNFREVNSKFEALNSKQIQNSKYQIPNVSDFGFRISDLKAVLPLLHTDAVQAFQFLKCDVRELGVDLMTLSAHKIYGPKGIGALYIKNQKSKIKNQKLGVPTAVGTDLKDVIIAPLITGGNQEQGLRSGTENVPAIVGFGKAVELAEKNRTKEVKRQAALRDYLWRELKKMVPEIKLNGSEIDEEIAAPRLRSGLAMTPPPSLRGAKRSGVTKQSLLTAIFHLPNNLNIYFPGRSAQDLTIELDLLGVAVSPGTACSARSANPSRVITALGHKPDRARGSLRLTLGRPTTKDEIKQTLAVFKNVIDK